MWASYSHIEREPCAKNQIQYSFNRKDGTLDIVSRFDIWKIVFLYSTEECRLSAFRTSQKEVFSHHHDIGHMVTNKKKKHKSRKARSQAERRSREELSANRVVALIEQWESERNRKACVQDEPAKWSLAE